MISKEDKEAVLDKTDIVEVIGQFVHLRKRGAQYLGISPFTKEKTASFFVNPKGFYKCFSSGKGGDVIEFLKEYERMSYPEALRWLADKVGYELKESVSADPLELARAEERHTYDTQLKFAHTMFMQSWNDVKATNAAQFIMGRGYTGSMVMAKGVGYAPPDRDYLLLRGEEAKLIATGLVGVTDDGRRYDYFRERIVFPAYSVSGKLVGFSGRTLLQNKNVPKYLHSKESPLFIKKKLLYGILWAKQHIIKQDKVYVVEGPFDYHAMDEAGCHNTVSTWGTSITDEQVLMLARFADVVVFVLDGDDAGRKAAFRVMEICFSKGVIPRFVFFPEGEDPDSFRLKYGDEQLRAIIALEVDAAAALLNTVGHHKDLTAQEMNACITTMVECIAKISEFITRELFIDNLSTLSGIRKDFFSKRLESKFNPRQTSVVPSAIIESAREHVEKRLATMLCMHGQKEMFCYVDEGVFGKQVIFDFVRNAFANYKISFTTPYLVFVNEILMNDEKDRIQQIGGFSTILYEPKESSIGAVIEKLCLELIIDGLLKEMDMHEDKAAHRKEVDAYKMAVLDLANRQKQYQEFYAKNIRQEP